MNMTLELDGIEIQIEDDAITEIYDWSALAGQACEEPERVADILAGIALEGPSGPDAFPYDIWAADLVSAVLEHPDVDQIREFIATLHRSLAS